MGNTVLKRLRNARGWTQEKAATELGMSRGGYIKVERGERRLRVEQLTKAAAVYQVSQAELVSENSTLIVGRVILGGIVELYDEGLSERVSVQAPPGGRDTTKVLLVEGGALPGIAEAHWLVFYDQSKPGLPDERLGQLCVLAVDGGAALRIGRAYRGEKRGLFDITIAGFEPVRGTTIEWSAEVTWIKPR